MTDDIIDIDDLFSLEKILVILGGLFVIIGVFLTWSTLTEDPDDTGAGGFEESWNGMGINDEQGDMKSPYHAYPIPLLVMGVFMLIAGVLNRKFMDGIMPLVMVVFAVLAVLFAGMCFGNVAGYNKEFTDQLEADGLSGDATIGAGLFLIILGPLIAVIGGIVILGKLLKEGEGDIRDLLHIHYEKKPKATLDDEVPEGHYITSQTAKRYHRSKCPYAVNIPPSGGILVTKEEALELGKKPCQCLEIHGCDDEVADDGDGPKGDD